VTTNLCSPAEASAAGPHVEGSATSTTNMMPKTIAIAVRVPAEHMVASRRFVLSSKHMHTYIYMYT